MWSLHDDSRLTTTTDHVPSFMLPSATVSTNTAVTVSGIGCRSDVGPGVHRLLRLRRRVNFKFHTLTFKILHGLRICLMNASEWLVADISGRYGHPTHSYVSCCGSKLGRVTGRVLMHHTTRMCERSFAVADSQVWNMFTSFVTFNGYLGYECFRRLLKAHCLRLRGA